MKIMFDMDGTIADFYGVEGWLEYLEAYLTTPYEIAKPLLHFATLARMLNRLQNDGYEIGIISWCSRSGTPEYNARVALAKRKWLAKHLPSVRFDEIHIVPYGTPKNLFNTGDDSDPHIVPAAHAVASDHTFTKGIIAHHAAGIIRAI